MGRVEQTGDLNREVLFAKSNYTKLLRSAHYGSVPICPNSPMSFQTHVNINVHFGK